MAATEARFPGRAPIDHYGANGFRFAGMSHTGSIVCLMSSIVAWKPIDPSALTPADFAVIFQERDQIDFVLLGTGARHALPPADVSRAFREVGLTLDVMATGPAARTFNIVLAEGRRAAAALIIPR